MATPCEQIALFLIAADFGKDSFSTWNSLLYPDPIRSNLGPFAESSTIPLTSRGKSPRRWSQKALNVGKHVVYEAFPIKIFVLFKILVVRVPHVNKIPAPLWMSHSKGTLAVCHWALMSSWGFFVFFHILSADWGGNCQNKFYFLTDCKMDVLVLLLLLVFIKWCQHK